MNLAAHIRTDDGNQGFTARSEDHGDTWTDACITLLEGEALPHLSPVWLGNAPVFAVAVEGNARLCRDGICVDAGSPRIQGMAVDGDTLWVLVDEGVGLWSARAFSEGEFGGAG